MFWLNVDDRKTWAKSAYFQSRTDGVLGAVPSAAVMGARRFFPGRWQSQKCKKLTFLVVTRKTQIVTVTTNTHKKLSYRRETALQPV